MAKKGAQKKTKEEEDAEYAAFQKRTEEAKAIERTLGRIKYKLVVLSGKGGVGKSTVAVNLASALAAEGHTVGLMDVDITGPDIPKMLGLEGERPNVVGEMLQPIMGPNNIAVMSMSFLLQSSEQAVVWRGPMKMGIIKEFFVHVEWGELDYLVIDLPPGTSDEPLSIAQYIKDCNGAIIITTPQEVSLLDISKAVNFTRLLKMPILGLVENMSGFTCPHCGKEVDIFKKGSSEAAAKQMDVPYLGSIPIDPDITSRSDAGVPFVSKDPDKPAVKAFKAIVEKIKGRIEEVCEQMEKEKGKKE
jgi:Mrp family chromosome partitioning ATPase